MAVCPRVACASLGSDLDNGHPASAGAPEVGHASVSNRFQNPTIYSMKTQKLAQFTVYRKHQVCILKNFYKLFSDFHDAKPGRSTGRKFHDGLQTLVWTVFDYTTCCGI